MTRCEKCGAPVPADRDLTRVPAVVQDREVAAAGGTVNVYVLLCDLCVARLVADDREG
ncbi:MAG: hypothetical protein VW082_11045 [Candidatus Nanopelagicales bacterium]